MLDLVKDLETTPPPNPSSFCRNLDPDFRQGDTLGCARHISIPPIPPIPPMPPPPPCVWPSSLGNSATIASVGRVRAATEAAFCSAQRVTLVGSSTPISTRSPYWSVAAL